MYYQNQNTDKNYTLHEETSLPALGPGEEPEPNTLPALGPGDESQPSPYSINDLGNSQNINQNNSIHYPSEEELNNSNQNNEPPCPVSTPYQKENYPSYNNDIPSYNSTDNIETVKPMYNTVEVGYTPKATPKNMFIKSGKGIKCCSNCKEFLIAIMAIQIGLYIILFLTTDIIIVMNSIPLGIFCFFWNGILTVFEISGWKEESEDGDCFFIMWFFFLTPFVGVPLLICYLQSEGIQNTIGFIVGITNMGNQVILGINTTIINCCLNEKKKEVYY